MRTVGRLLLWVGVLFGFSLSAAFTAGIHDEIEWVKQVPGIKFMIGNGTDTQWDDSYTVPPAIMERVYTAIRDGAVKRGWHLEHDQRGVEQAPTTWLCYFRKGTLELTVNLQTAGDDDRMIIVSVHNRGQ